MALPELIFDNDNHFVDITNDDVRIRFADTEEIEGHIFRYVENGIFAADPAFEISNASMYDMIVNYRDVVYVVENKKDASNDDDKIYKVVFAYSKTSSDGFFILNYINSHQSKYKKYYDFNQILLPVEYAYYNTAKLDTNNLPENKSALTPIYNPIVLPDGRKPWIKLNDHVGIEVENGIYYFATPRDSDGNTIGNRISSLPVLGLNAEFTTDYVAAICHSTGIHFSSDVAVEYLAIGKEYFPRLKEIQRLLDNSYYHELGIKGSPVSENDIADNTIENESIPAAAEELIKGLGFSNITVRYERPFFKPSEFSEYDIAYKLDDKLVLGTKNDNTIIYEYHNLRFLSGLYVKQNTQLNNGIDYPVIHAIISCGDARLKELLTPEAYSLYLNEINLDGD